MSTDKEKGDEFRQQAVDVAKEASRLETEARRLRAEAKRLEECAAAIDPGTRGPAMKAVMLDRQRTAKILRDKGWTLDEIGELFGVRRNAVTKLLEYSIRIDGEIVSRERQ